MFGIQEKEGQEVWFGSRKSLIRRLFMVSSPCWASAMMRRQSRVGEKPITEDERKWEIIGWLRIRQNGEIINGYRASVEMMESFGCRLCG